MASGEGSCQSYGNFMVGKGESCSALDCSISIHFKFDSSDCYLFLVWLFILISVRFGFYLFVDIIIVDLGFSYRFELLWTLFRLVLQWLYFSSKN